MKILFILLKHTNLTNKFIGTLISLYLLYFTRETVLQYDIFINNIKQNYLYYIILLIVLLGLFILFYKKFNGITNKVLLYSLNISVYVFFIIVDFILKSFYNKPNNFGITQTMSLFSNHIEIKKIFSLDEKIAYLNEIMPLLKNLSITQQNNLINNIDWNIIKCKNDLYVYIVSELTIEKTKIITQINEPNIFNQFIQFLYNHPYGTIITILIALGLSWYFKELILDYLKRTVELFHDFLKEHRKKVIADMKLTENQEIIGNQLEFIQKNILDKNIDDVALKQIAFVQQELIKLQKEVILLNAFSIENKEMFLDRINDQHLDIQKILDYLNKLQGDGSLI